MNTFFRNTLILFFVIDAIGNIPVYLSLLEPVEQTKRRLIIIQELFIALILMMCFHYFGKMLLTLLEISSVTVQISGGIVLFLIAIRLIFYNGELKDIWKTQKPFIVPIATPLIASPSVLAVIMIFAQKESSDLMILRSIVTAWFFSGVILLLAKPIYCVLKDKGLEACKRLIGLIIAIISIQLFLEGVRDFIK